MFVYDNEEQCTLIIFGDSGKELTGRKATELIDIYAEVSVILLHPYILIAMKLINECCYNRKMVASGLRLRFHCHNVSLIPSYRQTNSGSR